MFIWTDKYKAFKSASSALIYLIELRDRAIVFAKEHKRTPPKKIILKEDKMYYVFGCSTTCIKRIKLED